MWGSPPLSHAEQLTFRLPCLSALGCEDYFVSDANRLAAEWVERWPDWPGNALVLWGPAGSGKSHLAAIWRDRLDGRDGVVVEDIDRLVAEGQAVTLFHRINEVRGRGGTLLMTSRLAPGAMADVLPDLSSRLRAMAAVAIEEPDDALMVAVIAKEFADRQLRVDDDVIMFLMKRLKRTFAALHGAVAALDGAALREKRPITVPLAKAALGL